MVHRFVSSVGANVQKERCYNDTAANEKRPANIASLSKNINNIYHNICLASQLYVGKSPLELEVSSILTSTFFMSSKPSSPTTEMSLQHFVITLTPESILETEPRRQLLPLNIDARINARIINFFKAKDLVKRNYKILSTTMFV